MERHLDPGNPPQPAPVGVAVAVLAAGHGTRFNSAYPKHLHPVAGVPIVERVIRSGLEIAPDRMVVVVSEALADLPVRLGMEGQVETVVQAIPNGTADAVRCALDAIGDCEWLVSLLGDNPLLDGDMIRKLLTRAQASGALVTVLTAEVHDAQEYGRIECDGRDQALRIVEYSEADKPNRTHPPIEINSGIMVLNGRWVRQAFGKLSPHPPKNELFLTDLVEVAVSDHRDGEPWPVEREKVTPEVAVGVNDRIQQAAADAIAYGAKRTDLMKAGVSFVGPETSFVEKAVTIGQDTTILPGCYITGNTTIGRNCVIGPHAVIRNSTIGDGVQIASSTVTDSSVAAGSSVGPYARLRDGAAIGPDVHLGNFVEVKNSALGEGTKAGHLAYLGDATVGERVNIGAGVITANYDGVNKHRTQIGDDAFIGSDSVLVAPRTVGDRGRTAAGSVVTHDVPADTLVVGVPARPRTPGGGGSTSS